MESHSEKEVSPLPPAVNLNFDEDSLIISSGEHLPHWQCNGAIYHISFRLADSLPCSARNRLLRERENFIAHAKLQGIENSEEINRKAQYLYSEQVEKYLDAGHGSCYLKNVEIAQLVANSITHFDKAHYHLHAWCIMPNHVHIAVHIISNNSLSKIIHSWKSYTAHKANQILGLSGAFWQSDAYNHIIRSKKEYHHQIKYIWKNPDKARLKNWTWRWMIDR
jgi:REP element-mobilizing transposase RayT